MLHPLLQRQLRRLSLDPAQPPAVEAWSALLERIHRAYTAADQDRYLLERSLALSSAEMLGLHEAVQAERDRFEAVVRALDEAICALDAAAVITFVNPACERLLCAGSAELVGRRLCDVVVLMGPDGATRLITEPELVALISAGGPIRHDDAMLAFATGRTWPVALAVTPLLRNGESIGAVLALRDIAQQKRAAEALRRTDAEARKLALVASRTDNAVVITDAHERIEWINEGFTRIFGYAMDEVVGRTPRSLLHGPDTDPATDALMHAAISQGAGFEVEIINYTKAARRLWVAIEVQPVHDDDGRIVNFIAIESDITERKFAEAALQMHAADLQTAKDALEAKASELAARTGELELARIAADGANRAKSEFLANMSHEIRTPMTAILGFSDLMLDPAQSPSDRLECVQTLRRNGEHLLTLLNDILDLSKIEAGHMTIDRVLTSPHEVVAEVASLMSARAHEKDLEFGVECEGPIPARISTDPTRLRQILMNLVGNAIKFTNRGAVRIVVGMATPPDDPRPRIRFRVVDSGIGVTPE